MSKRHKSSYDYRRSPKHSRYNDHRSPKQHSKHSDEKKEKKVFDYKHELNRFLEDHLNLRDTSDFWKFYEKYQTLSTSRSNKIDFDRNKLLNITSDSSATELFDKLPVLDRNGDRIQIKPEDFSDFIQQVLIYQDFQQKNRFSKLKKLRQGQRDLPIFEFKDKITATLAKSRVVLIAGDTGCGKSTQVPQYVLEAGYNKTVCTQPRRIACVSLAKRVSFETLTDFKSTVGYQIRFERTKRADTNIIFMTEGLLLRQAAEQETLNAYDVIILDEIHERHLYGDFLVGIMKCLLHKRTDFKLILMSATINIDLFSQYFKDEAIEMIQVPGRLYPIDVVYKPVIKDPYESKRDRFNCTPYLQIVQMIDQKYPPAEKGDLLIFLNGFSEIATLADAIEEYGQVKQNWIVLQLHSTLSLEEQDKVFDYPPDGVRKCIISTNIAETSVTIDGIRFVIDSGKVNRMSYHTSGGINKLAETNISQDSAKQRAGRAGRTGPGICFRMYSEEDFSNFDLFTVAEIHLVPLESLLLHMISLGLSEVSGFPFLEKPSAKALEEAVEKLKFCGALDLGDEKCLILTPLGDALSKLPVDLTIGKMLIMSTVYGNVNSVLALAALLSVQSPYTQQAYRNSDTQNARGPLESTHGDPMTLLNLYREWLILKQNSTPVGKRQKQETSRNWAQKRGLEEQRFYEVTKLVEQFREILEDANLLPKATVELKTSGERSIRHGELKQLKTMRHQLRNEQKTISRKQLKFNYFQDGATEQKVDLSDIEFRISNDHKRLEKLLAETAPDSYKDLTLLKLILTSGLYPQVSVEDEFNSSKSVADRLYHTKNKNFIFLRPLSCFTLKPEILELHDDEIEAPPSGYFSKKPISRKHQVLIYQSILETKKVYLMNVMRMPAVQTLLLFGKTIATNNTITKLVVDDFLSIDLPHFGQGKTLLFKAIELRKKWKRELEQKLKVKESCELDSERIFYFVEELIKFTTTEVSYNVRRLLAADLKVIYTNRDLEVDPSNPFDPDYKITGNDWYGGLQVTENIVYDCLVQEDWAVGMERELCEVPFECPYCGGREVVFFEMLKHEVFCRPKAVEVKRETEDKVEAVKPNSKFFRCDKCDKEFVMTPVEILKHKRTCN